jgi:hypothetical protein
VSYRVLSRNEHYDIKHIGGLQKKIVITWQRNNKGKDPFPTESQSRK